ncbi:MAG: ABC transporter ATP-binding protein [Myxococcota bacterium]|nr:ABC transporter ATP-binding protein [Myxococcota bacterium]
MTGRPLVRIRSVSKRFNSGGLLRAAQSTVALDGVDLDIGEGEILALIGESGSGKTTLGKVITRLTPIDAGKIEFDGQDLLNLSREALLKARRHFQMIFQNQTANLHPKMSIDEMLDESIRLHQPQLGDDARAKLKDELAAKVGLSDRAHQRPMSLSGGERRRVGLARILATKPKLIVADEPTSGLDAAIKLQIIELLSTLKDSGTTYLLISHDLGLVRRIADRVAVMLKGRIIEIVHRQDLGRDELSHPYTARLIRATDLHRERRRPPRERRDPPRVPPVSMAEARGACIYADQCSLGEREGILDRCRSERPPLVEITEGRKVACFAVQGATRAQT